MTDVLYLDTHSWIFMLNKDLLWCKPGVTEPCRNDFELGKQRQVGYFKRNGDNQSLKCLYCSSIVCLFLLTSFFLFYFQCCFAIGWAFSNATRKVVFNKINLSSIPKCMLTFTWAREETLLFLNEVVKGLF